MEPPRAWAVIPPDQNISRHVEVLLSVENSILVVDNLESVDQRISRGPFSHVSPSPNGRLLALLNRDGLLWVVSTDFQRSLAEFNTQTVGADGFVNQVEWCSNDAILLTWNNLAILVGPSGDTLRYVLQCSIVCFKHDSASMRYLYFGSLFAVTEIDGVRVISGDVCDLIQKVPCTCTPRCPSHLSHCPTASSMSVFRPGSTSPAAILFDAWGSFTRRSPKADESIRGIRTDLAAAVNECIDAAGCEWEPHWQQKLLSVRVSCWRCAFIGVLLTPQYI